jgi:Tim44-like domain
MRWLLALIVGVVLGGALTEVAEARPGGGHSYSGGSSSSSSSSSYRSSSSSSSSSGSGSAGDTLIIIIGCVVVIVVLAVTIEHNKSRPWTSAVTRPASAMQLAPLREADPTFSLPVFEDFAFQLFAAAARARGDRAKAELMTPYFAQHIVEQLVMMPPVSQVVIGSLRVIDVRIGQETVLDVRIEANLATSTGTANVIEHWKFVRLPGVSTQAPPAGPRTFPCPQCNARMDVGRLDWTVLEVQLVASAGVGLTLTGTVAEVGTDLATVVDPNSLPMIQGIIVADKTFVWDSFTARVKLTYDRMNAAWNTQDLTPIRGLVTSSLHGYLQFWIDEYKRQQHANKLENAVITHITLAKVTRDVHYDAITVRVFAKGNDYTINQAGKVVGGSKSDVREYSEYWTFVRSAKRHAAITTEAKCPSCGAPLAVSDRGACDHCQAVVETGAFDFVLSKIEQDEVYRG